MNKLKRSVIELNPIIKVLRTYNFLQVRLSNLQKLIQMKRN